MLDAARENLRWCAEHGVHAVVGTTGFAEDELAEFAELFDRSAANAVIVPNFAIGAVLMMRFAEMAAPFFETAEIIELHHDQQDRRAVGHRARSRRSAWPRRRRTGPTTRRPRSSRDGARGGLIDGIPVHSVRMRGMVAHQEVLLGTTGQTLSIRHDTYDRASFMPGVLLAVRKIAETPGLTIGLDALLGL